LTTPFDFTAAPQYLPSGWLLWATDGTLVAQRLDVATAALVGAPVEVADGVTAVSVAETGLVAYRTGVRQRQLMWFDRSGTPQGTVGDPDASIAIPRVCPADYHRVVVERRVQGNGDIWLWDGTSMIRKTTDPASDRWPIWSPDCTRIAFRSTRSGGGDLYQMFTSGAGREVKIVGSDQLKAPNSWSTNGFLLYLSIDPQTQTDLWVVPMGRDRTPQPYLRTPFREAWGDFSPDGQWVAYQSNKTGRPEIYVRPFPAVGAADDNDAQPVSSKGGISAVWQPDGKELYYLDAAGEMMAVPITVTGTMLQPGTPKVLFPTQIYGGGVDAQQGRQYDVARDGRFLVNTVLDSAPAPITLLQNWNPAVKK
jgi:Tol biopolymer transport system component